MALQKKDREFRLPKISYLDFKTIEMDRVLTGLFERLEHGGYPSVFRDKRELTVDKFVDDILDATQPSDTLGKTAGKDADANKPTYVSLLGLEQARSEADALLAQALEALAGSGLPAARCQPLVALAHRIVNRDH